ncbi:hypothetical protein FA95DRAFT_971435, partial [Auriscalpium vulgare]
MAEDPRDFGGTAPPTESRVASTGRLALKLEKCTGMPEVSHLKGYRALVHVNGTTEKTRLSTTSKTGAVWNETFLFDNLKTYVAKFEIWAKRTCLHRKKCVGTFIIPVASLLESGEASYPLIIQDPFESAGSSCQLYISATQMDQHTELQHVVSELHVNSEALVAPTKILAVLDAAKSIHDDTTSIADDWGSLMDKINAIASVMDKISQAHPYLALAWTILDAGRKVVDTQKKRDDKIQSLIHVIYEVYEIVNLDSLMTSSTQQHVINYMAKQTVACSHFILKYLQIKIFWKRTVEHLFSDVDETISKYEVVFQGLKNAFSMNTSIHIQLVTQDIFADLKTLSVKTDIDKIPYAKGARHQLDKQCLPGTRVKFLQSIKDWILEPNVTDCAKVMLLTGLSGTGKSSVAHSIANYVDLELGCLGSSFFFDINDIKERNPKTLFGTIAHDLADFDPSFRHTLNEHVGGRRAIINDTSLDSQFDNFLLMPLKKLDLLSGPIVIVIDGLDESAAFGNNDRGRLIKLLSSRLTELPSSFHIFLTSRLEEDINDYMISSIGDITHNNMDHVSSVSTEHDIELYISSQLVDRKGKKISCFGGRQYIMLAQKSERLFQWAHIACDLIIDKGSEGGMPLEEEMKDTFNSLMNMSKDPQSKMTLLDRLYKDLLTKRFSTAKRLPMLRLFLGQLIAAGEPLSIKSLQHLYTHSKYQNDDIKFEWIISKLGSVLTGASSPLEPIQFIHSSFRDFLMNRVKSEEFCIEDTSQDHKSLAWSVLTILNTQLKFNMSNFPSSYVANSDIASLDMRWFCDNLSLSYASHYWGWHLSKCPFDAELENLLGQFVHKKILYWLEALSLLKLMNTARQTVSSAISFCKEDALKIAIQDVESFVQIFGQAITKSMPHLYFAAATFAPESSQVLQQNVQALRHMPVLKKGRMTMWPTTIARIYITQTVMSVAYSPDGNQIVCGCENGTISMWEVETGQPVGTPLQG